MIDRVGRSPLRDHCNASSHCSSCQSSRGRPSRWTSVRQNARAAPFPASNSCRSRKFSNHSRTSRNPARCRSERPRNSDRSFLQHQRDLNVLIMTALQKPPDRQSSSKCIFEHLFHATPRPGPDSRPPSVTRPRRGSPSLRNRGRASPVQLISAIPHRTWTPLSNRRDIRPRKFFSVKVADDFF